jgi:hypothetical protein
MSSWNLLTVPALVQNAVLCCRPPPYAFRRCRVSVTNLHMTCFLFFQCSWSILKRSFSFNLQCACGTSMLPPFCFCDVKYQYNVFSTVTGNCLSEMLLHGLFLNVAVFVTNLHAACLRCLCQAANECSVSRPCSKGYCGPFSISHVYWADAGRHALPDDDPERTEGRQKCQCPSLAHNSGRTLVCTEYGYPKRSPDTNSWRRNPPLQLSIQCLPQRTSKWPNSKPNWATRQQAIAKTPAKWSAYQIPSVTVVFVILILKV